MKREKRRLHIVLSLDNPLQREAWRILSQAKNKTSAVCEAVCGYQKQKGLEDTLCTVIREELKHIPVLLPVENESESESVVDAAVVDFLLALQEE